MVSLRGLTPACRYRFTAFSTLKWKEYGSSVSAYRLPWWPVLLGSQELSLPAPWKSYPWMLKMSSDLATCGRSQPAAIFAGSAGVKAVSW